MRILIDGRMAQTGGGYTYLVNIVPRLIQMRPQDQFRVIIRSERVRAALPKAPNLEVDFYEDKGAVGRLLFTMIDAPKIARSWGADLFFSVSEYAPATAPCPTIASFRNPNLFSKSRWKWPVSAWPRFQMLRTLARVSALTCDRIMFVSQDSANWIGDRAGLSSERRSVVHHGIEPESFAPESHPRPRTRPYILSVSSVYRYKNFVRLIEAYTELANRRPSAPDLVIIGDNQDPEYAAKMETARLAAGPLAERIHILGEVAYEDVKAYYANAECFVFPSYLETFGHPLLEAMASDTPLVASDLPVFREIAGNAAFYADPFQPSQIAAAMEEVLFQPEAREILVKEGRERLKLFTWDRTARQLLTLFESVLAERVPARRERVPARRPIEIPV